MSFFCELHSCNTLDFTSFIVVILDGSFSFSLSHDCTGELNACFDISNFISTAGFASSCNGPSSHDHLLSISFYVLHPNSYLH